jgi:hypothetical protein
VGAIVTAPPSIGVAFSIIGSPQSAQIGRVSVGPAILHLPLRAGKEARKPGATMAGPDSGRWLWSRMARRPHLVVTCDAGGRAELESLHAVPSTGRP